MLLRPEVSCIFRLRFLNSPHWAYSSEMAARRVHWSLAATVDEARPRPREDPRTLLATDVVVVDVRSGELVVVGPRAALKRYRVSAPQSSVHPKVPLYEQRLRGRSMKAWLGIA